MKKLLLIGVAAACALPMMAEADSKAISLEWMNTSLQANSANMRAMALSNGVMYIPNAATKKVEMWKDNAKIGDVPVDGTPMACFNISSDDAGNIIISMRDWAAAPGIPTGFQGDNTKLFVISPDGKQKATIDTNGGLPASRTDYFGHTRGNVFGEYATLYAAGATSYSFTFSEVNMADGKFDSSYQYTIASDEIPDGINDNLVMKTAGLDGTEGDGNKTVLTPTTAVLGGYNLLGDEQFAAILPHVSVTSEYATNNAFCDGVMGMGNSVFICEYNEDDDLYFVAGKYFRMPQHNGCTGFDLFELNGKQFILYPAGANNCDGWAIAEVSYADTPQSDKDDVDYLVCRKWAEVNEDGGVLYGSFPPGGGTWFFAEPSTENNKVVYVYQYTPGAYLAKYKVDLTKWFDGEGGVEGIENDLDTVEVYGGNGFIGVEGGEVSIYTTGGALVAKTSEKVSVAPGLYIANTGKRAVKVVVK